MKLYNSLTRTVEDFRPIQPGRVGMYTCGPTVYDYAHIGNFRAYLFNDLLSRYLRYRGFAVTHVMNVTDVDDKTIRRSQESGKSLREFTEFYTAALLESFEQLRMLLPDVVPRATDSIGEMVEIIQLLLEKDYAYRAPNGDIYYRIDRFEDYGALIQLDRAQLKTNAAGRMQQDDYSKDDVSDFALWKARTEEDGAAYWDTPLGAGRPGWHIECSAMARRYLGQPIDIHCGGIDLLFPHHTNEIAQSEAAFGVRFANYWMHNEHLNVDGKKMAKRLDNFFTVHQLLEEGMSARVLRFELMKTHYRHPSTFRKSGFEQATSVMQRFDDFFAYISEPDLRPERFGVSDQIASLVVESRAQFIAAFDDDLNISKGLAAVFDFMGEINSVRGDLNLEEREQAKSLFLEFDSVLGFLTWDSKQELDDEDRRLTQLREEARTAKNWPESDRLRDELQARGVIVEDRKSGSIYRKRIV